MDPDWNLVWFYYSFTFIELFVSITSVIYLTFILPLMIILATVDLFSFFFFIVIPSQLLVSYYLISNTQRFNTIKRKIILYGLNGSIMGAGFGEEEGVIIGLIVGILMFWLFIPIWILLILPLIPLGKIIVNVKEYNQAKFEISRHLDETMREIDIAYMTSQRSREEKIDFFINKSLLSNSRTNIDTHPILPNEHYGFWLLIFSLIFSAIGILLTSWHFIVSDVIPRFEEIFSNIQPQ